MRVAIALRRLGCIVEVVVKLVIGLLFFLAHVSTNNYYNRTSRQSICLLTCGNREGRNQNIGNHFYNLKMQRNKKSMDEISLDLTEKCIELDSRKYIPSDVKLEYSKTQISIQEIPAEPHSPLSIHQHLNDEDLDRAFPKIEASRTFRHIDIPDHYYNIESPENSDRLKGGFYLGRGERMRQNESLSLQSKLNKESRSRINDHKYKCRSLGSRHSFPPKLSKLEKDGPQTFQALKMRLEEEKRKYQSFRVTFRGSELKRSSHMLGEGEKQAAGGLTDFFARKIKLDYNETQEKKYLQRIILNRQSILHVSQRLSQLPAIREE